MSIDYPFQIEGADGEFSSEINGYLFTVTIKLFEVTGATDIDQLFNALTDSNVPLIGTDLSGVDLDLTGCWLRSIKATPLGNNQFRMSLQYQHSPFNQSTLQISTSTQVSQVEANKDLAGDAVQVKYLYPTTYGGTGANERELELRGTYSDLQGGTYSRLTPESTRVYTVREAVDGDEIARDYVGTLNDAIWQGGAIGTWMLTGVTGATDDSQQTPAEWVNSYTFQYRSDGWDPDVVFTDSYTNEPVPDPAATYPSGPTSTTAIGSIAEVVAYAETDFTDLFAAVDP